MTVSKLLIANRGEIAIRIARAAADMGLPDGGGLFRGRRAPLHLRMADEALALPGQGAAAYLNAERDCGGTGGGVRCHPSRLRLPGRTCGLSRDSCAEAGLTFVGPDVAHLELFGDKARARAAAAAVDVPVIRGLDRAVTLDEARAFFASLHGRRDDHQGGRRRRRTRHTRGAERGVDRPRLSTLPVRSAGRVRPGRSSTSRSSSRAPAMSRCRSSATVPALSRIWASGNAAFSAASRRSSKSPPRRTG